ncbi:MAG: radical SAM protein [Alphaproteobacteria bacterium]|nr:radical SAM protein [Alphaproteobacteria bacterium]
MDGAKIFRLVLIKPSHYDDDGYVIQWARSAIPSNTLATLYGLAADCAARRVLGDDVVIEIDAYDETNTRIRPAQIARRIRDAAGGMVGIVGVQSNQFPRAVDIARPLREAGIPVVIGGFHVSGCLAMLPGIPADIRAAMALGISVFAGEAEGRLEAVLRDAWQGTLQPVYNHMDDLPSLEGAVYPILPAERVARTAGQHTSFDAGRGCPFQCSFCTIINVQGRKSRHRSADDVERIVRANLARGIRRFFITDDNFARNKNWEPIFDRLIALREGEGLNISFIIQVDTLCHKTPGFVEKAARAGCRRVFIGLENINPDNLMSAKKRQNKITEYRRMLQMWKAVGVVTYAGYILGFPADTPERILADIEIIKNELPVDLLEFFCLTPLPGSEDHKNLAARGVWMDPDMNKYDLEHVTTGHARMSREEWQDIYHRVWEAYYTPEHIERIMQRAAACGISVGKVLFYCLWFYGCKTLEGIHPLEGGYLRRMYRLDRRPGLPVESRQAFYRRWLSHVVRAHWGIFSLWWRFNRVRRRIKADPNRRAYTDLALTPVAEDAAESLALFSTTDAAKAALDKKRREVQQRAAVAATG